MPDNSEKMGRAFLKEWETRCKQLNEEVAELIRDYRAEGHVLPVDNRTIFESWVIQKITGLQLAVEEMERRMALLLNEE
jgi:hypothetical protein